MEIKNVLETPVYVVDKNGNPLMPTFHRGKVRRFLKQGKAKIFIREPFTIQLLYNSTLFKQDVELKVDSGYLNVGVSAITDKKEVLSAELKLLTNVSARIKEKSMYKRLRKFNLPYRKPRFNNRRKNYNKRKDGWLSPSIQHKLDSHIRFIEKLKKILPITRIIVEVANFDIQKIKSPDIKGKEYQEGEQKDFYNLREYILHRDDHKCQNPSCKNNETNPLLQIHHIKYRSNGGTDTPNNLITLCNKCHSPKNHETGQLLDI